MSVIGTVRAVRGAAWCLTVVVSSAGCGLLPTPPAPESVRVEVSGDQVLVELLQLDNPGSQPLTVCLDNVVLQAEGGGVGCGIASFKSCIAMAPRSKMSGAPFQAHAACGLLPSGRVRVLADLRYRRTSTREHADVWQLKTILTSARVRHF